MKSKSRSLLLNRCMLLLLCVTSICISVFAGTARPARKAVLKSSRPQILTSQASGTATFNAIGFVSGYNSSEVRATNADGSIAIGASGLANPPGTENGRVAEQWTAGGGLITLPQIPADGTTGDGFVSASDITATGSWIAYRAWPGWPAVHRTEAVICSGDLSQVITLGRLAPNRNSAANQISDDGSIAFGFALDASANQQAFRWTQSTGMQVLAAPSGYPGPPAYDNLNTPAGRACSTDGSVSAGFLSAYDDNTGDEFDVQAYRWTQTSGMQLLGYLPGGDRSAALAMSADGSTIFGVSRSTNAPGTGQTNPWDYSGELFLWTSSNGMTALGVPAGYDEFSNFGGMSADGALIAVAVADSSNAKPAGFVVIQTGSKQSFESNDLLVSAGLGNDVSGWSNLGPLGISDNGDTLFGSGIDPNGLLQGWIANFPVGYLRNVQTFTASGSASLDIGSGAFIGRDGSYSASDLTIGGSGGVPARSKTSTGLTIASADPSLTLSGTATLSLSGTLNVTSGGVLNLLGAATVTAQAVDLASGATLGVELDSDAETISRLSSTGLVDLTGQPALNLILSYAPAAGTSFTVIHNTSGQAIQGQFSGLPENGTVLTGNRGVRASYSGGATRNDFVLSVLPPPPLSSVVSRMTHGPAGTFDLDLSSGNAIECRSSVSLGAGNYTLVFTFVNNLVSVGTATVTNGVGSVSSTSMGPNQYTVNLTGVSNAQTITVTLGNVIDSENNAGNISVPMGMLIGDTTANRAVNSSDIAQTQSQSGQAVTTQNFREDVTANGVINSSDISLVQSQSGTGLP